MTKFIFIIFVCANDYIWLASIFETIFIITILKSLNGNFLTFLQILQIQNCINILNFYYVSKVTLYITGIL